MEELQRLSEGTRVQVLDQREVHIDGVRFLGATLWTDFELFGEPQQRAASRAEAQRTMRGFSRIRTREVGSELFTPDDAAAIFQRHAAWLQRELAQEHEGETVVITHHAPTRHSIHPRFADSLLNACFVSDAEHLLRVGRVALWVHGHTHDSFDHRVHGTRVVCNPRGYARGGVNENAAFDPDFCVELGASSGGR
ncbi:MAG: metallophosphoesterase [Burkholderiaceae bacterium]|nr:MAG: metallophosphoesterase [Burkholderiaceae bacterium]